MWLPYLQAIMPLSLQLKALLHTTHCGNTLYCAIPNIWLALLHTNIIFNICSLYKQYWRVV
jgi:hypothetical protein